MNAYNKLMEAAKPFSSGLSVEYWPSCQSLFLIEHYSLEHRKTLHFFTLDEKKSQITHTFPVVNGVQKQEIIKL